MTLANLKLRKRSRKRKMTCSMHVPDRTLRNRSQESGNPKRVSVVTGRGQEGASEVLIWLSVRCMRLVCKNSWRFTLNDLCTYRSISYALTQILERKINSDGGGHCLATSGNIELHQSRPTSLWYFLIFCFLSLLL